LQCELLGSGTGLVPGVISSTNIYTRQVIDGQMAMCWQPREILKVQHISRDDTNLTSKLTLGERGGGGMMLLDDDDDDDN